MVLLTMTRDMVPAIVEYHKKQKTAPDGDGSNSVPREPSLEKPVEGHPISHAQIIGISQTLKRSSFQDDNHPDLSLYALENLLRGCRVYVPPPEPKLEPTSEYKTLMAHLRREEEARAYERMLHPPPTSETFAQRFPTSPHAHFITSIRPVTDEDEVTYADVNRQMALVINVLVSIVACSVAIWMAASQWSTPHRLSLSLGGGGLIGVAEVAVYAGYLRRVKEAKVKGKAEIETKEIVQTWAVGGTGQEQRKQSKPVSLEKDAAAPGVRKRSGRG